ncbi:MAG: hypothetical protein VKL60_18100 [Sphaerospermopsis sp.]|nr:hypothetical protein [Sphaerospermopsis sp.]
MTVSNSTNFNLVRNQIIELAYKRIGVLTDYRPLTAQQITDGATLLNVMVKSWITKGNRLWKNKQGTLFVQPNQASYILDGETDNATEEYVATTTTAAVNSGTAIIPVTSATGMIVGDNFGVVMSNGYIFWSTIQSINSLNVTLNDILTEDVNDGAYVYAYTTKINRPEDILNAQCQTSMTLGQTSTTTVLPMVIMSRDTYRAITIKNNTGIPNRLFYDKQKDYGAIYLWQTPSSANYLIEFTWQKQLFDFDSPTDDPDFPVEWLDALHLNLAVKLAGFNAVTSSTQTSFLSDLKQEAKDALDDVLGFDRETTSIYFEPATEINTNTNR